MSSVDGNILSGLLILIILSLLIYMKAKNKSFREVFEDVKGLIKNG